MESQPPPLDPFERGFNEEDVDVMVDALRKKARREHAARILLDKLNADRRATLIRAITNVLSTELAMFIYAQIIDGLPTEEVAWDQSMPGITGEHPIDDHEELCPGAMDKARELCQTWDPAMLMFNPALVNAYQRAVPGTKAFQTRLIELVAVALHQIGAILFQLDFRLHQPASDIDRIPRHHAFLEESIYPEGVADVVGYWAEDRILGNPPPPNVYFYACREKVTFRPFQLRDDQQQSLVDFFLLSETETPSQTSPLPIRGDKNNRVRLDAQMATLHGFFRDIWERRQPTRQLISFWGRRPHDQIDYPKSWDLLVKVNAEASLMLPEKKY
ncbi:hypothetical protein B0H63DRAFT_496063 [Podospora didyma]|uniref:Uncharacterized protein n=1 Tax=Podospora didyma TaxID=330526 RepID=A0AAE0N8C3_9PEZI|nr:hypothetical protein B0H63DRAFT_496063 [Podospora didyma]